MLQSKQIILLILILLSVSKAQTTLTELLQAYKIPYLILPSTQEPVMINTQGKITQITHTRTALSDTSPNQRTITTTEKTSQIVERTAFILTPLTPPESITLEINPQKAPPLDIILDYLKDRIHIEKKQNILVIKQLWQLQNLIDTSQPPEVGTYDYLLQKALSQLKQPAPRPLQAFYSLIPIPDLLVLCQLHAIKCYPLTDEITLIDNPEPVKAYLTQTRPRIHIQAYVLLLTATAKSQLQLSIQALLSQANIPQFFTFQNKDKSIIFNAKRGILNALEVQLKALAEKQQASILASPSLLLDDRQTASIRQGYEIPVVTPATQTSPATTTYKNAYLSLTVQPVLLPNSQIRLSITLNKDSPDFANKVGDNIAIQTNAIQTIITIPPETPILIGGVAEESQNNTKSYGFLFFNREKSREARQLYILVYARLVDESQLTVLMPPSSNDTVNQKPKPKPEPEPETNF